MHPKRARWGAARAPTVFALFFLRFIFASPTRADRQFLGCSCLPSLCTSTHFEEHVFCFESRFPSAAGRGFFAGDGGAAATSVLVQHSARSRGPTFVFHRELRT